MKALKGGEGRREGQGGEREYMERSVRAVERQDHRETGERAAARATGEAREGWRARGKEGNRNVVADPAERSWK